MRSFAAVVLLLFFAPLASPGAIVSAQPSEATLPDDASRQHPAWVGAQVTPACALQEAWCLSEWFDVGLETVELGLTLGATTVAIETCGATLGLSCVVAAIGYHESDEAIGDFLGAIDALRACLNED